MSTQIYNKPGRPRYRWFKPTKMIRVPEEYAAALIEIALEWQQATLNDK